MFHVWWLWNHCTITSRLNAVGKKYLRQKSLPWRQNSVSEEKKSTNDSLLNTVPTAPNTFILKLFRWRLKNNQCVNIQTKSRQMINCHLYYFQVSCVWIINLQAKVNSRQNSKCRLSSNFADKIIPFLLL